MSATAERPSSRPFRPVVLGCVSFAVGGPLVASLVWPAVMLIAWSLIDGPSWEVLKVGAGMVPLIFVASFLFGYFVPAAVTGGIMGAIGTRIRRRWFVLLGMVVGAGAMIGFVELVAYLLKSDKVGDIDAIATLDAIVTSAVLSHWLHRRLARRR
jgi:MFS family permease